jgi:heterotetrameric sarcosine oxidase gamma subunit
MRVSAPDLRPPGRAGEGLRWARCPADIVEIAALRDRADEIEALAARRGWRMPVLGRCLTAPGQISISVRPGRCLLLSPPASPGETAAAWARDCAALGAVVDQSSGLAALWLEGAAWREALARGCRLDLDPGEFPAGRAAATVIAQVAASLVALSSGVLLLTPATTARHFCEWLAHAAAPFGISERPAVSLAGLSEDPLP